MNVVVHKARHPQLASYIHSATAGLLPFIEKVIAFLFLVAYSLTRLSGLLLVPGMDLELVLIATCL